MQVEGQRPTPSGVRKTKEQRLWELDEIREAAEKKQAAVAARTRIANEQRLVDLVDEWTIEARNQVLANRWALAAHAHAQAARFAFKLAL